MESEHEFGMTAAKKMERQTGRIPSYLPVKPLLARTRFSVWENPRTIERKQHPSSNVTNSVNKSIKV